MNIPIHYVSGSDQRRPKMEEVADELKAAGKHPYIIPLGASDEVGAWGFVRAMEELKEQQDTIGIEFDTVIHACSSGGTTAGMEVGKRLFGLDHLKIIGISADDPAEEVKQAVLKATNPVINQLSGEPLSADALSIDDHYVGEGYGIPTELSDEAFNAFIDVEGITLDPVYTAKAAGALIDYTRRGMFDTADNVLFWHTGGLLNLFR